MSRAIPAAVLASILTALQPGSSSAQMVAGWDFSQYVSDAFLSIDLDLNPATSLPANYSHFDPTFAAGAESADFGTFHYDGQFGSTSVNVDLSFNEPLVPVTGSLQSGIDVPVDFENGFVTEFESFTILIDEGGQDFANPLRMQARDDLGVVFRVVLPQGASPASAWRVLFAGQTRPTPLAPVGTTGPSTLGVEFGPDCSGYESAGSVVLDGTDKSFEVDYEGDPATSMCVRMNLATDGLYDPTIDNVAVFVPEPAAGAAGASALGALLALARRKRART